MILKLTFISSTHLLLSIKRTINIVCRSMCCGPACRGDRPLPVLAGQSGPGQRWSELWLVELLVQVVQLVTRNVSKCASSRKRSAWTTCYLVQAWLFKHCSSKRALCSASCTRFKILETLNHRRAPPLGLLTEPDGPWFMTRFHQPSYKTSFRSRFRCSLRILFQFLFWSGYQAGA